MKWLNLVRARLRGLLRREAVLRDIDEELRSHVEMETHANIGRGMTPDEARLAALRSFGDLGRARELVYEVRGGGMLEVLWQDLRYGARMLVKQPGFTLIAVLTLALGIGANTAIFTVVSAVLLRPLPYPGSERLVQAGRSFTGGNDVSDLSEPKFIFLRDNNQSFEAVTATQGIGSNVSLSGESQTEYISGMRVTADFFHVLGVNPALGRGFTKEEDSPKGERVAILGDGLWRRHFGADAGVLGRRITLNDTAYTVVGIMPPGFEYYGPQDVFVPMRVNPASQNEGHNWTVVGRLKQGVTPDQARTELKLLFERFRAAYPAQVQQTEVLGVMNWRASMTSGVRELLWILLGAVSFVLLIACSNVANLQLARAATRRKEMAVRTALGAGGWRLVRQLLTEGVVLALLGGFAGLLLAIWMLDAMLAQVPEGMLPRVGEISLDWRVLAFALGASLLTGIIFGLAPALQILRVDVTHALKVGAGKTVAGLARGRMRSTLVVIEVALALALTVGTGLLLRTFANLRGVEPGFEARGVLTFEVSPRGKNYDAVAKTNDFYARALERFRGLPGVEAAALTNRLPLDRWFNLPYRLPGQGRFTGSAEYRLISLEYFRVMGMTIRRGRAFDEGDRAGAEPVLIINEEFARRAFAGLDPLGQQLCLGPECEDLTMRRVVGVVNETKQRGLIEAAPPIAYIPLTQATEGVKGVLQQVSFVLSTTGDPTQFAAVIRDEMRRLDPSLPVRNLRPMEELVSRSIAPQRFNLLLLSLFAALGLVLAAIGIYGVMAYSVAQRAHEIGIRTALGAQSGDVLRLVIGQGMKLALAGVALGLIASAALTRTMKSLLFGVSATDPATFTAIALLLTLVALAACWIPARRATKVDPLVALRYE